MPLQVPPFLVSPLRIHCVDDDRHVIAYFSGHPEFECVEAMFSARSDGTFSVRAILTRRDQTQIDFVNDPVLLLGDTGPERVRVVRDIRVTLREDADLPVAEVEFDSLAGERVVLRIACASRPDASRGGLTDPGAHALGSSLPLMWRQASAVAGRSSCVHIAGVRYAIPELFRQGPHFVAHHGYHTQGFHMAAIRNESRAFRVVQQPRSLRRGAQWVYETSSGQLVHEIESKDDDGTLRITSSARPGEIVHAVETAGRLLLEQIVSPPVRTRGKHVALSFGPSNAFSIRLGSHADVLRGAVSAPDPCSLLLAPQSPAWAIRRPVHVRWAIQDDLVTIETACRAPGDA
jgi:hypothetical protein